MNKRTQQNGLPPKSGTRRTSVRDINDSKFLKQKTIVNNDSVTLSKSH